MFKRLKIRLYPSKEQEVLLQRHVDAYRFLYNLCLEYKITMYRDYQIQKSGFDIQNELFNLIKEIPWIKGLKVECLRQAALDVDKSFKNFFSGKGFPKFKSKLDKNSFCGNQAIRVKYNKLLFFKQKINFKTSIKYKEKLSSSKIKQCTFIKDRAGKWWASCLIEDNEIKIFPKSENKIGCDLGLTHFMITSNGEFIDNPRFIEKEQKKLKKLQRKHSKTKKGGKNREKLRVKIAKIFQKITNQKEHFFHQVSNKLIFENQEIHIESLKVANMVKNRKLSKAISDVSWAKFVSILEYKCLWYNRTLIKSDTYFASSKLCSNCGHKKENLKLSDRIYKCSNCNFECQRDINAAKNLVNNNPTVKNTGSHVSGDLVRPK